MTNVQLFSFSIHACAIYTATLCFILYVAICDPIMTDDHHVPATTVSPRAVHSLTNLIPLSFVSLLLHEYPLDDLPASELMYVVPVPFLTFVHLA